VLPPKLLLVCFQFPDSRENKILGELLCEDEDVDGGDHELMVQVLDLSAMEFQEPGEGFDLY
jgi:hypothetical protein